MTAWAGNPQAAQIDALLDRARKLTAVEIELLDAARGAPWYAERYAAWDVVWDVERDAARHVAWVAARDVARDAARHVARGAPWYAERDVVWDVVNEVCDNCGSPLVVVRSRAGRFCTSECAEAFELS